VLLLFFPLRIRCPPSSTLFPYTTLFRSQVIGATSNCTCVVANALPLTIADGARGRLSVSIRKGQKSGRVSESVVFYSDSPETPRSEEHTSELQSRFDLVCRLLLEKKKKL